MENGSPDHRIARGMTVRERTLTPNFQLGSVGLNAGLMVFHSGSVVMDRINLVCFLLHPYECRIGALRPCPEPGWKITPQLAGNKSDLCWKHCRIGLVQVCRTELVLVPNLGGNVAILNAMESCFSANLYVLDCFTVLLFYSKITGID